LILKLAVEVAFFDNWLNAGWVLMVWLYLSTVKIFFTAFIYFSLVFWENWSCLHFIYVLFGADEFSKNTYLVFDESCFCDYVRWILQKINTKALYCTCILAVCSASALMFVAIQCMLVVLQFYKTILMAIFDILCQISSYAFELCSPFISNIQIFSHHYCITGGIHPGLNMCSIWAFLSL